MPSHNSRTQHHPARCIERIHSNQRNRQSRDRTITCRQTDAKTKESGNQFRRSKNYYLLLRTPSKNSASHFDIPKRHQPTRSKPLLSRQQHPRDNDREQIVRARQAAEALFTSKSPVTKPAVTESAAAVSNRPQATGAANNRRTSEKRCGSYSCGNTRAAVEAPDPAVAIFPHPLVGKIRHDGSPGGGALRRRDRRNQAHYPKLVTAPNQFECRRPTNTRPPLILRLNQRSYLRDRLRLCGCISGPAARPASFSTVDQLQLIDDAAGIKSVQ